MFFVQTPFVCAFGRPRELTELKTLHKSFQASHRHLVPIAVIDDEPLQYLAILRDHGFTITVFNDISDVKALEAFPIVLCDIKGVGKAFKSKYEGAHVIAEIRKHYPQKILAAYSGQQFDPSYNQFFEQCDFVIKKDVDSDAWIERLDEAIQLAIDPIAQWKRLRTYLLSHDVPLFHLLRLEDDYVTSMLNKSKVFPRRSTLKLLPEDAKGIISGVVVLMKLLEKLE